MSRGRRTLPIVPYACGCEPLCDDCFAEHLARFKGAANLRGITWARRVAERSGIDRRVPWPVTPKARAIALRKVADLTADRRLKHKLADLVELGAAAWWGSGER